MLKVKKLYILLLVFSLISSFAMVMAPDTADAAAKIKWSKVYKGSYNSPSPYTLNWTGNVMDRGGFSLYDMALTSDSDTADFIITQSGSIAAGGILKLQEELEDLTDISISNFKSYESVAQGAVYLIILHDGTWAKLKIDTVVKSYMDYLSKVTFSFVIEEDIIEDKPTNSAGDSTYKPGQFAEDVAQGLYDEDPFADPEYDLLYPGVEYTFEEGPITVMFDALEDQFYFDLYRSDNGGPYKPVSDFLLEEPEFVDNYAFAGHTYLYIFVAYDEYGVSEISLPLKINVVKGNQKVIVMKLGITTATVDGETVKLDAAPVIVNSRTLVPVRFISEALGAKVDWDGKTSTVTITLDNKVIVLKLNSSEALVNGVKVTLDVPAKTINSRTMVPVRFVSESLDQEVSFDNTTQEITIIGKGSPTSSQPSENNSNQGNDNQSNPANNSTDQDDIKSVLGKWDMWIPSLDYKVPSAPVGILTISANNTWSVVLYGETKKGSWEIDASGKLVLLEYTFGWDWYISKTDTGIKAISPPAAYQEGTPVK